MPDCASEFDQILDYLNERTCHQCQARFRDDDRFARHIRAHREGDWETIARQTERTMIADLMQIREQTGG